MPPQAVAITRERRPLPPIAELLSLADVLYKGGLQNKSIDRPEKLVVRIVAGWELGLSPIQSINNIMVTNGRATVWGDTALALIRASGLLESIEEWIDGTGDKQVAICRVKRRGEENVREYRFSVADAKQAKLWQLPNSDPKMSDSPWVRYPQRMLQMKARNWLLRDVFADVLCGLGITEDADDATESGSQQPRTATPVEVTIEPPKQLASSPSAVAVVTVPVEIAAAAPQDAVAAAAPSFVDEIIAALPDWLASKGRERSDLAYFKGLLVDQYGVESIRSLRPEQQSALLLELESAARH
jgi:hypothetical protein